LFVKLINYRDVLGGGGGEGEEVCDMNATSDGSLVEFDFTQEYTAQCSHGYAEVGVYLYVGPNIHLMLKNVRHVVHPITTMSGITLPYLVSPYAIQ
jgi:hypothetical protein